MKLALDGGDPVRSTPFPKRQPYGEEEIREVSEALLSQNLFYLPGHKIAAFEQAFAARMGRKYALACSSGTAAVHLAIAALDLEPGSEVITCPVTDFGTISGMIFQGLVPIFADWAPGICTVDPAAIERAITPRTAAIVVVHLFGNACDMDAISAIAKRHNLPLIEDCCQAYLTEYRGRLAGQIGRIGCFSMQMSKHLPAGEGGVVICDDDQLAMRMSLFRDKGWENRSHWGPRAYTFLGLNYRMNELTGAVALAQLRKLDHVVDTMRRLGDRLADSLQDTSGLVICPRTEQSKHTYWLFPMLIEGGRDAQHFVKALQAEGVPCGWGYTVDPIYLCTEALTKQRTFGSTSYPFSIHDGPVSYHPGLCPVAETELKKICTLRIYETWTESDIDDITAAVRKVATALPEEP